MFFIWSQELCTCCVDWLGLELDWGGEKDGPCAQCTWICRVSSCSVHGGWGGWGLWKRFRLSSRGGVNWTLKDFSQFRPLKIVFTIWKTLMNLGVKDIGCSKEINWFKSTNESICYTDRYKHTADSQSHRIAISQRHFNQIKFSQFQ